MSQDESEEFTEESREDAAVRFIGEINDRISALESKVSGQDKAIAQALRAVGGLVLDMVVVCDENSPKERVDEALNRINRFTDTLRARMEKK